jgi:hypothetical protein
MRVATLERGIEEFCKDHKLSGTSNGAAIKYEFTPKVNPAFTHYPGCPSHGPGDQTLRNYDLTFSAGGINIYVETGLGDVLYNGSMFRLNDEDAPRRTTPKLMKELAETRERKQDELNAKYQAEGSENLLGVSIARNGITAPSTVKVWDWEKHNLGSIKVPLVDSAEDVELNSANIISAHIQYDISNYLDEFRMEDFNHPFDQIKLKQIREKTGIGLEGSVVDSLCLNDVKSRSETESRGNNRNLVFGASLPINNLALAKKRLEKLRMAGENFVCYYLIEKKRVRRIN